MTRLALFALAWPAASYSPARVVDTHVHNSNLSLPDVDYTYPSSFADLGAHGDCPDFARPSSPFIYP